MGTHRVLEFSGMKKIMLNIRFLLGRVYFRYRGIFRARMTFPTYSEKIGRMISWSNDRVRHATMADTVIAPADHSPYFFGISRESHSGAEDSPVAKIDASEKETYI